MSKLLFSILVWLWCRQARLLFSPGRNDPVQFNTVCFRIAILKTTGLMIPPEMAEFLLIESGYGRWCAGGHLWIKGA